MLCFLRQRGLCAGQQSDVTDPCPSRLDADTDKDYVSAMWIRSRDSPASIHSASKSSPWRDPDNYSTYTTSELPPCTPLMERGARPPLYGQLQQKLPCGCSTYVDAADVSEYVSRQQLLQSAGGRQEKLILKPGEPTQYFIVESDRPLPVCPQPPAPQPAPTDCREAGPGGPGRGAQPDVRTSRPNVVMQTDDIKLRLRITDLPPEGAAPPAASHQHNMAERQPLMEEEEGGQQEVGQAAHALQGGPPPDVSYTAICKERLENEANDEQSVPKCSHLH